MIHLQNDEQIIYTARKHSVIFFTEAMFIFILMLIPLLIVAVAQDFLPNELFAPSNVPLLWYFYILWIIAQWLLFVYVWTDYYLDAWVVTNKHIIDIDQDGLFNRKVSTSRLDLIQDVTVIVPGILATLVGYGDIHMQTAGQNKEFVLKGVARPYGLKNVLIKEHDKIADKKIPSSQRDNTAT